MCQGPQTRALVFTGCEVAGVPFATELAAASKKQKHCIVMVRSYPAEVAATMKCPADFGLVRHFIKAMRPGALARWSETGARSATPGDLYTECLFHADWFDRAPEASQMTPGLNCPTVRKTFKGDPAGNTYYCSEIVPTHLTLAPCKWKGHTDRWQVLHDRDFDFLTKQYPETTRAGVLGGAGP